MKALLDASVLVALTWPNHVHHGAARRWFAQHQAQGWATCPTTQSALVRISSNAAVIPEARTPEEAVLLLRRLVALPHHEFWPDDTRLASARWLDPARIRGYRQVTDAHLLALAIARRGRLATLDAGVRDLLPRDAPPGAVAWLLEGGEAGRT